MTLLSEPNHKLQRRLGDSKVEIMSFSMSPRKDCGDTMTPACNACYDYWGLILRPNVRDKRQKNGEIANDPSKFFNLMNDEIADNKARSQRKGRKLVLRLHVGGDFKSVPYIMAWYALAVIHKDVVFYFYTRAWQDPIKRGALETFKSLPNVHGFASYDPTMTQSPPENWKIAVMGDTDLKAVVCPWTKNHSKDCASCGLCFKNNKMQVLQFPIHGKNANREMKKLLSS